MHKKRIFFVLLFAATFCLQGCIVVQPRHYPAYPSGQETIVYEQPYYEAPPFAVVYPYRYWMYVPNGDYVDVVFVGHDGFRHSEPWHHNGDRMTHHNALNWHRDQYQQHRNMPAEKHKYQQ
ncbi:MAG: hypothetical protein WCQ99_08875 [Pseudomonadota bacterium]